MTYWNYRYWNYRLVKKLEGIEEYIIIMEVYYNEKDEIVSFGEAPVPYGENPEEVKECLDLMHKALNKEIINYDDYVR